MMRRMSSLQGDALNERVRRKRILVRGVVQGVGFRPFVYKVATSLGLSGYVFNSSSGVTIEIEGHGAALDEFFRTLKNDPPKLAEIKEITALRHRGSGRRRLLDSGQPGGGWCIRAGLSRRRHLRRVLARFWGPGKPALRISIHQLHPLRAAVHHHPRHTL